MELFYEPLPRTFEDIREREVIIYDDEGYPLFSVMLDEIP